MRLSVFSPTHSPQLLIDLKKLYHGYLDEQLLTDNALQDLISDTHKLFFVTLFNARHLGAVQVSIHQQAAELTLLCVRDITRRRGVGKNLLREVEKQLKEKGVNEVRFSLTEITESGQQEMCFFLQACGYQLNQQSLTKTI